MMKKYLILVVVILSLFILAGTAAAQNIDWPVGEPVHYNFSLTTADGCAACHVTHTATVAKLLWGAGPPTTQTGFCYVCHANNTDNSPYDVENGIISPDFGGTENASWAGSFGFLGGSISSRHSVEDTITAWVGGSVYDADKIPGNAFIAPGGSITGNFKCTSCHDPHAGDDYNDRLLREKPLADDDYVVGDTQASAVDFDYNANMTVSDYAYDLADNQNLNKWCGQCHGKFNRPNDAAKNLDPDGVGGAPADTMYRHPMNVDVNPSSVTLAVYLGAKNDNANPTAAAGANYLNCLTCHKAHGTIAVPGSFAWTRDGGATAAKSSVLLRYDKRGVCYDCHGAASKNLEDYTWVDGNPGNPNQ